MVAKLSNMNSVFKALADPTRRRVLQLLRERPMTAGELAEQFAVSKPTMSAHFSVLKQAGLIEAHKEGRTITYRIRMSVLEDAMLGFANALHMRLDTRQDRNPGHMHHPHTDTGRSPK